MGNGLWVMGKDEKECGMMSGRRGSGCPGRGWLLQGDLLPM